MVPSEEGEESFLLGGDAAIHICRHIHRESKKCRHCLRGDDFAHSEAAEDGKGSCKKLTKTEIFDFL